jgi:hypothetical protein
VYTCKANWKDTKSDGISAYVELSATEAHKENQCLPFIKHHAAKLNRGLPLQTKVRHTFYAQHTFSVSLMVFKVTNQK